MQNEEGTMTAWEAKVEFERAGLSESTLRRWARDGKIHRVKNGVYSKGDVLKAINMEHDKKIPKNVIAIETARLLKATVDDMPELAVAIEAVFGTYPDVAHWSRWLQHNPDIAYILRSNIDGRIVGTALIMPYVAEKKITDILSNDVGPTTNPEDLVKTYTSEMKTSIYIRSVGVLPGTSKRQKRAWGLAIIRGLRLAIVALGSKGVIIDRIYSRSETADGINILQHLGFTEIVSNTLYRNYMIDVSISGLPMILRYKEALNRWRIKYEDA